MKILVIGGAGFIGSNLANALINEIGHKRRTSNGATSGEPRSGKLCRCPREY
jgi:nucleoside-diphosphate-sugar epimerase